MQLQYGIHDLNPAPTLSDLLIKEDYHKASHILSSSITHQIPRNPSFSISGPFRASTALIHHSVIRELTVNQPLLSLALWMAEESWLKLQAHNFFISFLSHFLWKCHVYVCCWNKCRKLDCCKNASRAHGCQEEWLQQQQI